VAEHAFPLYNLADATALRNHVLERFEAADAQPDLVDDGALTFVVVGGGPTGVEVAGALAELFARVLRKDFRRPRHHPGPGGAGGDARADLLAPFSPASRRHALDTLRERGVEVRTGVQVQRVGPRRVVLAGGEELAAHTLVWAAGVQANPVAAALGLPTGRGGRVVVEADLSVAGHPNVWAVGDVAAAVDPAHGSDPLPQVAPVAMQAGRHVARQISNRAGTADPPIRSATATRAPWPPSGGAAPWPSCRWASGCAGSPAWLAWLGLHLVMLAGLPQPGVGVRQLGLELAHLGSRPPGDLRERADPTAPGSGPAEHPVDRDLDGHPVLPLARLAVPRGVRRHRPLHAVGVGGHHGRALEREPPATRRPGTPPPARRAWRRRCAPCGCRRR
jgi:NADH dehydrogenase